MKNKSGFILIVLLCVGFAVAGEKEQPYKSLIDNSPFLTPAFKARLGKHDTSSLKFIGYTQIGTVWHFALIDKKSGKMHWAKIGEDYEGIKIESFDEKTRSIHLTVADIPYDLTLAKE
ncbi:hypothetical protein P4E94_11960 [Pontiellaceae bacterium B12219]|nr:hypothetical protein [Pontiellaceae bacterium B12219]